MKQTNLIKIIILVALILGELAVWTFPTDKTPAEMIGAKELEKQVTLSFPDKKEMEIPEPEKKPVEEPPIDQGKSDQEASQADVKKAVDKGLLILVNKKNYLDKDYVPNDLEPISYYAADRSAEGRFMRREAAEAFNGMAQAASEAGYEIVMTTAYRSYSFQSVLYNNYVAKYGQKEADKFSAKPGYSEHQTGLAVDVSSPSVGYALTEEFDKTAEWKWLAENASSFGFILRYPNGKTEITGYMYEAWHFRYVGRDAAEIIKDENITLEEYIDKYN